VRHLRGRRGRGALDAGVVRERVAVAHRRGEAALHGVLDVGRLDRLILKRRAVLDARLDLDGQCLSAVGYLRRGPPPVPRGVGRGHVRVRLPAVQPALRRLPELLIVGLVVPVARVKAVHAASRVEDGDCATGLPRRRGAATATGVASAAPAAASRGYESEYGY